MAREIAFKVPLSELEGEYFKGKEKFDANYLISKSDLRLNRVSVWGVIVRAFESEEKEFKSLTLDDFSGTATVNFFSEQMHLFQDLKPGISVKVVGKIKQGNQGLFVLPESVRKIDFQEELMTRLENLLSLKRLEKTVKKTKEKEKVKEDNAEEYFTTADKLSVERKLVE